MKIIMLHVMSNTWGLIKPKLKNLQTTRSYQNAGQGTFNKFWDFIFNFQNNVGVEQFDVGIGIWGVC